MDYQQSIKNLNQLKNFIQAWDQCHIFCFFKSQNEFEIKIFNLDYTNEQQTEIDINRRGPQPFAVISSEESGEEIMYYKDQNLTVKYDMFTETLSEIFFKDPTDEAAARKEFLILAKILENK